MVTQRLPQLVPAASLAVADSVTTAPYPADSDVEGRVLRAAATAAATADNDPYSARQARERLLLVASRALAVREAYVLPALRRQRTAGVSGIAAEQRATVAALTALSGALHGDWYARTTPAEATRTATGALFAQLDHEAVRGASFSSALDDALALLADRTLPTRPHATALRGRRARWLLASYARIDAALDVMDARVA
jgi:hypothetical protein